MSQLYYNDTPLSQMPASYPASRVTHESVSVTADGSKTVQTLLTELKALVDFLKITNHSVLEYDTYICPIQRFVSATSALQYNSIWQVSSDYTEMRVFLLAGTCHYRLVQISNSYVVTSLNSDVPANGTTITLYY